MRDKKEAWNLPMVVGFALAMSVCMLAAIWDAAPKRVASETAPVVYAQVWPL